MEPADEQRQNAIERLKNKRSFTEHLVSYIVVNGFLVIVWAMTGAGYFWPAWVMVGWGVGLVLHAWTIFFQKPITEADIQQEMRKGRDGAD
jgi:2TM domain